MRPILTIAIPTYNRVDSLKRSLQLALDYFYDNNVEIFISDNASTDYTKKYIESMQKKYPRLGYFCNEKNLGLDGNFLNCMKKASGEYLWMLSDDDYIVDGCKEWIFKALNELPVFIHLNTSGILKEGGISKPRFTEGELDIMTNRNEFLAKVGIYITFVTSMIYRTDYIREIKDIQKYYCDNLLLSHVALKTMAHKGKYIIVKKNCAAANANDKVSYDVYRTWIKEYGRLLLETAIECGFSQRVVHELLYYNYKTMILFFVLHFRKTCRNEMGWDKSCISKYIGKFPDLIPLYDLAIDSPVERLDEVQNKIIKLKTNSLIKFCGNYQRIIVFGTGLLAKKIFKVLKEEDININCFVISNDPVDTDLYNIPIKKIENVNFLKSDGLIVALKYEYQQEVKPMILSSMQAENIYWQDIFF